MKIIPIRKLGSVEIFSEKCFLVTNARLPYQNELRSISNVTSTDVNNVYIYLVNLRFYIHCYEIKSQPIFSEPQ